MSSSLDVLDLDPALLPKGTTPLHSAANNTNTSTLSSLMQHYERQQELVKQVNQLDRHGRTPLCCAMQNGRFAAACLLIEAGTDLAAEFAGTGRTHSEILSSDPTYQPLLLKAVCSKIELHVDTKCLGTFLHSAVYEEDDELLQTLLADYNVEVESRDHMGRTPMHYACQAGHVSAIKILLDYGATITPQDSSGSTPLHLACGHGHIATLELLLQEWVCPDPKESFSIVDSRSRTCVHVALYKKQFESFSYLLTHFGEFLNLDLNDDNGHSLPGLLFHMRFVSNSIPASLSSSLPFLSVEEATWSLLSAIYEGNLDAVRNCLPMAKLDIFDHTQHTPLMLASKLGHLEICRLLVDAGADPNLADPLGRTCLQCACESGHVELANLLLSLPSINLALFFDRFSQPLSPDLLRCFIEYFNSSSVAQKPTHWQKWLSMAVSNRRVTGHDFSELVRAIAPADWLQELAKGSYVYDPLVPSVVTPHPTLPAYKEGEQCSPTPSKPPKRPFRIRRVPLYAFKKMSTIQEHFNAERFKSLCFNWRKAVKYHPLHEAAASGNTSALVFILGEVLSQPPALQCVLLFETCNDAGRSLVEVMAVNFAQVGSLFDFALVDIVKTYYNLGLCESMAYEEALLHYLVVSGGDSSAKLKHLAKGASSSITPLATWPEWYSNLMFQVYLSDNGYSKIIKSSFGRASSPKYLGEESRRALLCKLLDEHNLPKDKEIYNKHNYLDLFQAALRYGSPWIASLLTQYGILPLLDIDEMKKKVSLKGRAGVCVLRNAAMLRHSLELKINIEDVSNVEIMFRYIIMARAVDGEFPEVSQSLYTSFSFWKSRFPPRLLYLLLSSGADAMATQLAECMIRAVCNSVLVEPGVRFNSLNLMIRLFDSMSQMYVRAFKTGTAPAAVCLAMRVVAIILTKEKLFFHSMCSLGLLDLIQFVVENMDLDTRTLAFGLLDHSNTSPLYHATVKGHLNVVEYLISKNCPVMHPDKIAIPELYASLVFLKSTLKLKVWPRSRKLKGLPSAMSKHQDSPHSQAHSPELARIAEEAVAMFSSEFGENDLSHLMECEYFFGILGAVACLPSLTPATPVLSLLLQGLEGSRTDLTTETAGKNLFSILYNLPPPDCSSQTSLQYFDEIVCHLVQDSPDSIDFLEISSERGLWKVVANLVSSEESCSLSHVFSNAVVQNELSVLDDLCTSLQSRDKLTSEDLLGALHAAVQSNKAMAMEVLLKLVTDTSLVAPLLKSIRLHRDAITDLLLGFVDSMQQPLLQITDFTDMVRAAASSKNQRVLEKLFQGALSFENPQSSASKLFHFWSTVLEEAAKRGHEDLALQALGCLSESQLVSVTKSASYAHTLNWCCSWGMKNLLECLPFASAQLLEPLDESKVSPWVSAVANGHIGKLSHIDMFPSLRAVLLKKTEMVQLMLSNMLCGAFHELASRDVQEKSFHNFNWYPKLQAWPSLEILVDAFQFGFTETAELYLQRLGRYAGEYIAYVTKTFDSKCNLLSLACSRSNNLPIVELTLRHLYESPRYVKKQDYSSEFLLSVSHGQVSYVQAFVRCIPKVFEKAQENNHVLCAAVSSDNPETVDYVIQLLDNSAPDECYRRNSYDEYPLYLAFSLGRTNVIRDSALLQTAAKSNKFTTQAKPDWRRTSLQAFGWFDLLMRAHTMAISAPGLNVQCTESADYQCVHNVLSLRTGIKMKHKALLLLRLAVCHQAPTMVQALITANGGVLDGPFELLVEILPDLNIHKFMNAMTYRQNMVLCLRTNNQGIVVDFMKKHNNRCEPQATTISILKVFSMHLNADVLQTTLMQVCRFGKERVLNFLIKSSEDADAFDHDILQKAISTAIDCGHARVAANLKLMFPSLEQCKFTSTHPAHRFIFGNEEDYYSILQCFFTSLSVPCQRMPVASQWLTHNWSENEAKIIVERLRCTEYAPPNPWVFSHNSKDLTITVDWDSFSECLLTSPAAGTESKFRNIPLLVEAIVFSQAILGQVVPQACTVKTSYTSETDAGIFHYCQATSLSSLVISCVVSPLLPSFSVLGGAQGLLTICYLPSEGSVLFPELAEAAESSSPNTLSLSPTSSPSETFEDLGKHYVKMITKLKYFKHCQVGVLFSCSITERCKQSCFYHNQASVQLGDIAEALKVASKPSFLYKKFKNTTLSIFASRACPFKEISIQFDVRAEPPTAIEVSSPDPSLLTLSIWLLEPEQGDSDKLATYDHLVDSLARNFRCAEASIALSLTLGKIRNKVAQVLRSSLIPSASADILVVAFEDEDGHAVQLSDCDLASPWNQSYFLSLRPLKSFLTLFCQMLGVFLYKPRLCCDVSDLFAAHFHVKLTHPPRCEFSVKSGMPHLTLPVHDILSHNFSPLLLPLFQSILSTVRKQNVHFPPPTLPAPFASEVDMSQSSGLLFPIKGVAGIITVQLVNYNGVPINTVPSINCHLKVCIKHELVRSPISASSSSEPSAHNTTDNLLVRATSSGTFEVVWTPQCLGQYDIKFCVNGMLISRSPYSCYVREADRGSFGIRQTMTDYPVFFVVSHRTGPGCCFTKPPPVELLGKKSVLPHVKPAPCVDRERFIAGLGTKDKLVHPISMYSAYSGKKKWVQLSDGLTCLHISRESESGSSSFGTSSLSSLSLRNGYSQVSLLLNASGRFSIFASCANCNSVLKIHWRDGSDLLPCSLYVVASSLSSQRSIVKVLSSSENVSRLKSTGEKYSNCVTQFCKFEEFMAD